MKKDTIVILTTGGTIAGVGAEGVDTGYVSGAIRGENLVASVPELAGIKGVGDIVTIEVCNVNSDDIRDEHWLELVRIINALSPDENIKGFVITHGTDTMEETAFFLSLTLKTDKPVIITGAMHPSTSNNPDGPKNMYDAVSLVAGFDLSDAGCFGNRIDNMENNVSVYFSGRLINGLYSTKVSTTKLNAFEEEKWSDKTKNLVKNVSAGFPDKVKNLISEIPDKRKLPRVNTVYFGANADVSILEYAASVSDGIVIAGAGSGEFSKEYIKVIENLSIPVAVCSRIPKGSVTEENLLCPNTEGYGELSPQKAAILLKLRLMA